MNTIWYTEPSGANLPNPTTDQMLDYLRRGYDEYWGPYSPVGMLCRYEHPFLEVPTLASLGTATLREPYLDPLQISTSVLSCPP